MWWSNVTIEQIMFHTIMCVYKAAEHGRTTTTISKTFNLLTTYFHVTYWGRDKMTNSL